MDKPEPRKAASPSTLGVGGTGTTSKRKELTNGIMGSNSAIDDPYIYASMIGNLLGENGPFAGMANELSRAFHFVTHTRKETQERIAELESKSDKIKQQMDISQHKTSGNYLDKLR
jgi:hypothetical protein